MARTTDKRELILKFITSFTADHGYSPSVREICAGVGLASTATVHYHLSALKEQGLIHMTNMKNRTISLSEAQKPGKIPIVGIVTAGQPILAVENIEDYLSFDAEPECFALRVRGDSMIGAGILSGDLVVVRPQQTAESGQIVVALLDDSATVKRFCRKKGRPWLMPENPAYEPIDASNCQILGLVRAVVREY